MTRGVRVFGRVTISRIVAAQSCAAFLARAKMHPRVADLHAFGALADCRLFDGIDRIEMGATTITHDSMSLFRVTSTRNAVVDAMPF
jgi:hypothetical protein